MNASVTKSADYQKQIKDLSAQGANKGINRKKIVREVETETDEEPCTNFVYDGSEDASLNSSVDSSLDACNIDALRKSIDINLIKRKSWISTSQIKWNFYWKILCSVLHKPSIDILLGKSLEDIWKWSRCWHQWSQIWFFEEEKDSKWSITNNMDTAIEKNGDISVAQLKVCSMGHAYLRIWNWVRWNSQTMKQSSDGREFKSF